MSRPPDTDAASAAPSSRKPSIAAFATVVAVAAVVAIGYLVYRVARSPVRTQPSLAAVASANHVASIDLAQPYVLYRHATSGDSGQGDVWRAALTAEQAGITDTQQTVHCNRAYFAAGHGLCLLSDFDGAWQGIVRIIRFDTGFNRTEIGQYTGIPSRARVSRDGKRGAFTIFVVGHSYAIEGFSTQTMVGLLDDPRSWVSIETFQVYRADGSTWRAVDFNFWGVTFTADSNVFYATLGSGGHTYLVRGDIAANDIHILREGVECPSLSPDGTRLAFKHAVRPGFWAVHVLDLRTMAETALEAEQRNVDDQVEWLDDGHLLYGLPNGTDAATSAWDIWSLSTDGQHAPALFLANADSPAVVRP